MASSTRQPAQAIIDISKERGYLTRQYYLVISRAAHGLDPVFQHLDAHLSYHEKLEADGIEIAAGPPWTADGKEWEGGGMMLFKADSVEAAHALADADPLHSSGARTYEIVPWMINHGIL
jgi:uncharacterized protein YciI